jgi:hypothetical protein
LNDITLLTLLATDKKQFERFSPLVKEYILSAEGFDIFKAVSEYYKNYPSATAVKWDEFTTFFFMVKGKVKPTKATDYRTILEKCQRKADDIAGLKPEELPKFYQDVQRYYVKIDYLTRLTNLSLEGSQRLVSGVTENVFDEAEKLLVEARKEIGRSDEPDQIFVPRNLSAVIDVVSAPGLEWPLKELNISLGPLRKGDFVLVGAYVETGKTTFAAQTVSHMVRQLKPEQGPILWINNEEQSSKVMFRIIQSYFGVTTEELLKNAKKYEELYTKEVGDRILLPADDSGFNSVGRLNRLFREFAPSLIVFDQLDKVHLRGEFERDDLRLGGLYKWARTVAKDYAPVIAITQVDATGARSEWITSDQLRGSKVDKPAEADAIITIGKSQDVAKQYSRFIHFPKNKLLGGGTSKEEYRHGFHEVLIKPEIARYVGTL